MLLHWIISPVVPTSPSHAFKEHFIVVEPAQGERRVMEIIGYSVAEIKVIREPSRSRSQIEALPVVRWQAPRSWSHHDIRKGKAHRKFKFPSHQLEILVGKSKLSLWLESTRERGNINPGEGRRRIKWLSVSGAAGISINSNATWVSTAVFRTSRDY